MPVEYGFNPDRDKEMGVNPELKTELMELVEEQLAQVQEDNSNLKQRANDLADMLEQRYPNQLNEVVATLKTGHPEAYDQLIGSTVARLQESMQKRKAA